jgi:photosystem II stability/assembly factor-like uncharacterized protein
MPSTCLRWLSTALLLTILAHPAAAGVDRWTPIGPEGGEIVSLAADPDAPGTLYAGTVYGGVWKSIDGGGSWAPTVEGLRAVPISSLAVAAGRVYAASFSSDGLNVLTDGAAAWRQVGPSPYSVQDLAIDPADPERIWMAGSSVAGGEIVASDDAGEHWGLKLRIYYSFLDVTVAPTAPPTIYAGGDEGIFASRDGGASWRPFDRGDTPPWKTPSSVRDLQIDPQNAETVYAAAYSGFWRTTDGGEHWVQATEDLDAYYQLLALPGALLSSVHGVLMRSEDAGDTWDPVDGSWGDISALVADPAAPGGAWLATLRGGLFRTSDGGRTWTQSARRGLRASFIQSVAFDPFRPGTLYAVSLPFAGAATGKLQRSLDAGASWGPTLSVLDVSSIAADPRRPAHLYAGTPRGVAVSRDRGAHWQRLLREPQGIDVVAVDPHRPGTLWAAGRRFWRSRDAGRTWKRLASPIAPGTDARAAKIFPSPWHPETLYLIDSYLNLRRSTDDGATWEVLDQNGPSALAFDPVQQDLLYLADASGNLRKSLDGGTTWEPVASVVGGVAVTALLIDRLDPSVFYAGTAGNGVWRSPDQGVTWQPFSAGLIAPAVTCLEADPRNPRHLVACTQGGGLLEIQITSGS